MPTEGEGAPRAASAAKAADVVLGALVTAAPLGLRAVRIAAVPAVVGWRLVRRPPLVPEPWTPAAVVAGWQVRGRQWRVSSTDTTVEFVEWLLPVVAVALVDRIDLTALVRRHATQDVVDAALDGIDLAQVVTRVVTPEVTAAVAAAIDPVDLVEQHLDPVVVEKLVVVALPPVMASVLAHLDLTSIVRENVDLVAITNEVVSQIDLASIANEVIDEIDLPEIIRESTSGVATEVMRGTRASAASADEAIANFFGRRRHP